ncbi:MAG: hypothetical protein JW969_07765 [Spirochaetales bacterium]|nr:hypothetical protein [Spirochaetales bacterium]
MNYKTIAAISIFTGFIILANMGCVGFQPTDTSRPGNYRVKKEFYSSDGNTTLTEHVYNKVGQLIQSLVEFSSGEKGIKDYTYDANGCLSREYYHASTSTYAFAVTYENDNNCKPLKRMIVMNVISQSVTTYEYDPKGHLLRTKSESKSGVFSITEYLYDDNWRLQKTITSGDNGYTTSYLYDGNGYLLEEISVNQDGARFSAVQYAYEMY